MLKKLPNELPTPKSNIYDLWEVEYNNETLEYGDGTFLGSLYYSLSGPVLTHSISLNYINFLNDLKVFQQSKLRGVACPGPYNMLFGSGTATRSIYRTRAQARAAMTDDFVIRTAKYDAAGKILNEPCPNPPCPNPIPWGQINVTATRAYTHRSIGWSIMSLGWRYNGYRDYWWNIKKKCQKNSFDWRNWLGFS